MLMHQRAALALCEPTSLLCRRVQQRSKLPSSVVRCQLRQQQHMYTSLHTVSSQSQTQSEQQFQIGATLRGLSGRTYSIKELLAERQNPFLYVYRASAEGNDYIVKNVISDVFKYQEDLQRGLTSCPTLRTAVDTVPEFEIFVYPFMTGNLLQVSAMHLPKRTRKSILRSALSGLAELHDRSIIHTDIKPNNILLDYKEIDGGDISVQSVKIADLEDAVQLPPGKHLKGCLCGNLIWRSPESWAAARQNTPSDIFSFGLVAICVMHRRMVLRVPDDELNGNEAWRHIIRKQISYFGDVEGFKGLLHHIGEDNPFFERFFSVFTEFGPELKREPFALWHFVDAEFRDLVVKMTNLDPAQRITAREALEHPWFYQDEAE